MAPTGGVKPKATQQTLFGFFSKTPSDRSTPSRSNGSVSGQKQYSSPVNLDDDDGSLTPPPTVRKPIQASSQLSNRPVVRSSHSPTDVRSGAVPQPMSNGIARRAPSSNELTPPSSSPPPDIDMDEDQDEVSRFPRRRAATKRSVKYIESDDEEEVLQSRGSSSRMRLEDDEEDDDDDCFRPEKEMDRASKKSRLRRNGGVSDSDDEFDDFIEPDDELLGALDEVEKVKKKAPVKAASYTQSSMRTQAPPSSMWSSSARPMSSAASTSKTTSGKKSPPSEEQPYDFLMDQQDENRNRPSDPEYDPRTLYIPQRAYKDFTPFEKQYWDIKRKHYDTVLFFQKGKFFELYENDALIAHQEFGLKLTDRVKMKMAGVPESSYTMFANKFLALGYKVGRVDQTETAVGKDMRKAAAGSRVGKSSSVAASDDSNSKIVRRDLRSIMTNGTIVDADCLPDDMSSYCVSIKEVVDDELSAGRNAAGLTGGDDEESMHAKIIFGICILEAGVAQFKLHHFEDDATRTQFETLLRSLRIKEVLYEKGHLSKRSLRVIRNSVDSACNITMLKSGIEFLNEEDTLRKLNLVLNKDLADLDPYDLQAVDPVDIELLPSAIADSLDKPEAMSALGGMLTYLTQLNLEKDLCASRKFDIFDPISRNECMILDAQSLAHLNILLNEQGDTQGTLLQLVNRAVTPFGKRLMKVWLLSPLAKIESIQLRQDAVEEFMRDNMLPDSFYSFAKTLPDIERIMPRIYAGNCKSKDFAKVLKALTRFDGHVGDWKELSQRYESDVISVLLDTIPSVSELAKEIHDKYEEEGFEPRRGCDEDFDEAVKNIRGVEKALQSELTRCAQRVKVSIDKVKFKDVGTNEIYQIEVPIKTNVPPEWALISQTQSVKRYYSSEIRSLVKDLKEARETKVAALKAFQARLFIEFQEHGQVFLQAVKGIAELDCLISLAKASHAMSEPTCRPEFIDSETALVDFIELRHPCLTSTTEFISNDIRLGGEDDSDSTVTILTGGNMAGKSTTARTTATGVILAQLGCRVPAINARLSPIDRIATRMGANDQLFRNNSTFMVEMLEASRILKDGTSKSLVIMDELGRGTSTFDGQAIAYAVLHYLIGQTRSLCFFLTHYTQLAYDFEGVLGVKNKHMQVIIDGQSKKVIFTYKLVDGIAESSYGTEVAALAGIPNEICTRAHAISKAFLESTREVEIQRRHNIKNKLETSTISDFVHLLKVGLSSSGGHPALSGKTIAFMRKQMEYLFDTTNGNISPTLCNKSQEMPKSNAISSTRVYTRKVKPRQEISSEIIEERSSCSISPPTAPLKVKKSASRGEQMILDLGQKIQLTCSECGMTYDKSDRQDTTTHEKHHQRLVKGIEWTGKALLAQGELLGESTFRIKGEIEEIKVYAYSNWNRLDAKTKSKLGEIHESVDTALGATPLNPHHKEKSKTIVAICKGRVFASLIVGPTTDGKVKRVEMQEKGESSGALFVPKEYVQGQPKPPLGVYRIHVLPFARRCGLASTLIDCALQDCVYGISGQDLIKQYRGRANVIAFSQPTQSGRNLAEDWIRKGHSDSNERFKLLVFDEDDL